MPRFYRDLGIPEIERMARSYCRYCGTDPDEPVQETGYDETTVPRWWKHQEHASVFLGMMAAWLEGDPAPPKSAPSVVPGRE